MSIHESKSITASNDYEFTISEANGNWQDNKGNYGKSRILFYIENEKECMGMTQLYTTFDSLELSKKIILYDLYVRSEYRNKGIGRMLMNAAKSFAEEKGVTSVELSTAITNKNAQSLYESLNYQRDTEYYDYYLQIK